MMNTTSPTLRQRNDGGINHDIHPGFSLNISFCFTLFSPCFLYNSYLVKMKQHNWWDLFRVGKQTLVWPKVFKSPLLLPQVVVLRWALLGSKLLSWFFRNLLWLLFAAYIQRTWTKMNVWSQIVLYDLYWLQRQTNLFL